jgi:hypothetical protein
MTEQPKVYCHCEGRRVEADRCDGCGPADDDYDDFGPVEDPPLYPPGKLASMTLDEPQARGSSANAIGKAGSVTPSALMIGRLKKPKCGVGWSKLRSRSARPRHETSPGRGKVRHDR